MQAMLNENYSIQETCLSLVVTQAASFVSYWTTSTLIQTGYKFLFGGNEVVTIKTPVQNQPADLIVDDVRSKAKQSIQVETELTVSEIAKLVFEYVTNTKAKELELLLEQLKQSNRNALKLVINYVHLDLSGMPTALAAACQRGDDAMAKILLSYEPNIECGSENGTPLLLATRAGNAAIVKMLCKLKADITCLDPITNGNLLHVAAENKAVEVLQYFRQAFPAGTFNLAGYNRSFQTPFDVAKNHKDTTAALMVMMDDIKQAAKNAEREKMREQIQTAGFSAPDHPCYWQEQDGVYALAIPCEQSQPLSSYLNYLTITDHVVEPNCIKISEKSVFCLAVQIARDDTLWDDYYQLLSAVQQLITTAGFTCEMTFINHTVRIESDSSRIAKVFSALKLKSILTLSDQSCFLQLEKFAKLASAERQQILSTIQGQREYFANLRNQFAALRHGIPSRKIKLIHAELVVVLLKNKYHSYYPC